VIERPPTPEWLREMEDPTRLDRALKQQREQDAPALSPYAHRAMMHPSSRAAVRVPVIPPPPEPEQDK
jgi:hypothetical protein